ncbi:MAG TPA: carbohydrate ABC transporter permease [Chloroflexota bacterium]|jgi:ABC-type glycerol-3-phosphate transport system permease component|nr:carbohydrate ABC transporter permease [Chloroflexota bacterium]
MVTVAARPRPAWRPGRLVRSAVFYGAVVLFVLVVLLPIYYIFLTAFAPGDMLFTKPLSYLPRTLGAERFGLIFTALPLGRYLFNTFFLSTVSTLVTLLVSFLGAYAIARLRFPGANAVMIGLLASGMLPAVTTVIPLFQMYQQLGLMDTLIGILILYVSGLLPFTTWTLVSFLKQMPEEVEEAAKVDGAGIVRLLWDVVLPMIRPGFATLFIIGFITHWNEFFIPLIFSRGDGSKVITMALQEAQVIQSGSQFYVSWGNMSAVAIVAILPVFVITLVFQKQIVEGIMAGVFK